MLFLDPSMNNGSPVVFYIYQKLGGRPSPGSEGHFFIVQYKLLYSFTALENVNPDGIYQQISAHRKLLTRALYSSLGFGEAHRDPSFLKWGASGGIVILLLC